MRQELKEALWGYDDLQHAEARLREAKARLSALMKQLTSDEVAEYFDRTGINAKAIPQADGHSEESLPPKGYYEIQAWREVCRQLEKAGAVTRADLESPQHVLETDGQKLLDAIRVWGKKLSDVLIQEADEIRGGIRS